MASVKSLWKPMAGIRCVLQDGVAASPGSGRHSAAAGRPAFGWGLWKALEKLEDSIQGQTPF